MDWKIEVVPVPVADLDRARAYYADQLGFAVDLDIVLPTGNRLVQLTPQGSGCSIHLNAGLEKMAPGGLEGIQIIVDDIEAAKAHLDDRGVEAGPVQHIENGEWIDGKGGEWNSFIFFNDPDGNGWIIQERPAGT
jgi:catechol 2,3-dioxygenase-like lactoylglutathione lyase family enzyme